MKKIIFSALFLNLFIQVVYAEKIVFKDGSFIRGTILEQTEEYIKVNDQATGVPITYYSDEIESIEKENDAMKVDAPTRPVITAQEVVQTGVLSGSDDSCLFPDIKMICGKEKETYIHNYLLYNRFVETGDVTVCDELIGYERIVENCQYAITGLSAMNQRNREFCEQIQNDLMKAKCFEHYDLFIASNQKEFKLPPFEELNFLWGLEQFSGLEHK